MSVPTESTFDVVTGRVGMTSYDILKDQLGPFWSDLKAARTLMVPASK
jgi:hypothetical protein